MLIRVRNVKLFILAEKIEIFISSFFPEKKVVEYVFMFGS